MGRVQEIAVKTADIEVFAKGYLSYLVELIGQVDLKSVAAFAAELDRAREADRTIFLAGNGGSAATASHMANDLGVDVARSYPGRRAFRAISLVDNPAVVLAIANDESFENIFVNQLKTLYSPGDVFIAISASGNSANVVKAARWVKQSGGVVLALTGFDGGDLSGIADVSICVRTEKGDYGPVEDLHMIMDHLLGNWSRWKK